MSLHHRLVSLLAVTVLTSGLLGCTGLDGLLVKDKPALTTPAETVENPGNQLLSNAASNAIGDVAATLREVGALKNMASQQPLLSNSGGNLLSNSMSGYRIASTALPREDFDRIVWNDSRAEDWPGTGSFAGKITGTLDGVIVESYSYSVTMEFPTYLREETVELSSFREKGLYVVTGATTIAPYNDPFSSLIVSGTSTFDPDGLNRKLDYELNALVVFQSDTEFDLWDVRTTVTGAMPTGAEVDLTLDYTKNDVANSDPQTFTHKLSGLGNIKVGDRTIRFKTSADIPDAQPVTGHMQLGLATDFWLRFDFAADKPLEGSLRNDLGTDLGALEYTEDKKKVIINHPNDKPEHLDLDLLPGFYRLGLESTLPPF